MAFDWKQLVGTLAPTVATALGGPLAGLAVKTLSSAIFNHENATEEDISIALAGANAETLAGVKKADQEFKIAIQSLGVKLEELRYKDRDSARDRQVKMKDITPAILVYLLTAGFFIILGCLFEFPIPEANQSTIYLLIGSLATACVSGWQYFLGSSRSSAKKDEIIGNNK